jgi:hypothetical protein
VKKKGYSCDIDDKELPFNWSAPEEQARIFKAIDEFSGKMKARLTEKIADGYGGWNSQTMKKQILNKLFSDIEILKCWDIEADVPPYKERFVDIANRAMMLYFLVAPSEVD